MRMSCREEVTEGDLAGQSNGGGGGGHGHSHGGGSCSMDDPEGLSLLPFIDTNNITCLNESKDGMGKSVFKTLAKKFSEDPFLESNSDDLELLIHIPFTAPVKLKSFCIIGGAYGKSPAKVKLMVNHDDIDFDTAQDHSGEQTLELMEDFEGRIDYPVRAAKFRNISSLSMYIFENFGAETTQISYIGLKGEGSTARRGVVDVTYEARAQLKDHQTTRADRDVANRPTY